jgi:hypothetical protein
LIKINEGDKVDKEIKIHGAFNYKNNKHGEFINNNSNKDVITVKVQTLRNFEISQAEKLVTKKYGSWKEKN